MGKSVLLGQVKAELEADPGTRVVLIEGPPAALTVEACLGSLAKTLGVAPDPFGSRPLFDEYFSRDDAPERLVLLFDEFDRYAEKGTPSSQPPGRGFFNDLEASRRSLPRLGILESSALYDDPIITRPIASLLNLPRRHDLGDDRRVDFLDALMALLARLHRSSADFFRPDRSGPSGKRLVPEWVFAAHLGLGFELLGWRSEREAQRGAGRTDLLVRRNGEAGVAVVEVKLWGRNDYRRPTPRWPATGPTTSWPGPWSS